MRLFGAERQEIWNGLRSVLLHARRILVWQLMELAKFRPPKPKKEEKKKKEMIWDEKRSVAARFRPDVFKILKGDPTQLYVLRIDNKTLWALDLFVTAPRPDSDGNPPQPQPEMMQVDEDLGEEDEEIDYSGNGATGDSSGSGDGSWSGQGKLIISLIDS